MIQQYSVIKMICDNDSRISERFIQPCKRSTVESTAFAALRGMAMRLVFVKHLIISFNNILRGTVPHTYYTTFSPSFQTFAKNQTRELAYNRLLIFIHFAQKAEKVYGNPSLTVLYYKKNLRIIVVIFNDV